MKMRRSVAAGWALIGAILTILVSATVTAVRAQDQAGANAQGGGFGGGGGRRGQRGQGGGQGGGGRGQGFGAAAGGGGQRGQGLAGQGGAGGAAGFGGAGGRGGGAGGGAATISSNDSFVFVLRGNTLYKLDVRNLTLLAQANLPAPGQTLQANVAQPPAGQPFTDAQSSTRRRMDVATPTR